MSFTSKSIRLLVLLVLACAVMAGQQWQSLFDGKTLKGWENVSPLVATWVVENGNIVGRPFGLTPENAKAGINANLAYTGKQFADFTLEFEVSLDFGMNSGVNFRSNIPGPNTHIQRYPRADMPVAQGKKMGEPYDWEVPVGNVYGYQFELMSGISDNSQGGRHDHFNRAWSGNVWDESRREKYLDTAFDNRPGAPDAFKDNQWNKCRVECRGDHMKTWINGVACADFHDSSEKTGYVALQVHGGALVTMNAKTGKPTEARFRNIRIQEFK
jgi:hypothetical protein